MSSFLGRGFKGGRRPPCIYRFSLQDKKMAETLSKWGDLLSRQAGLNVTRDGYNMEFKPRNVLDCGSSFADFEYEIQIFEEGLYFFSINGDVHPCKLTPSPGSKGAYYIDQKNPIRYVIKPGDVLRLELSAVWQTKKGEARSQVFFEGVFAIPDQMDCMGAPGYNVFVPHLETQAYLSVGNIINTAGETNLEILAFHIVIIP